MTTFFQFQPSNQAPFQFQPTLDSAVYNCTVTWSLFRVGYYLSIYALDGTLILSRALVGSPTGVPVQSISWSNGRAYVTTITPHGYSFNSIVDLTMDDNNAPSAYSGVFECLITGPNTFWFSVMSNPGPTTSLGTVSYDIDLAGQYFDSTLVFRDGTQNFEVNP